MILLGNVTIISMVRDSSLQETAIARFGARPLEVSDKMHTTAQMLTLFPL